MLALTGFAQPAGGAGSGRGARGAAVMPPEAALACRGGGELIALLEYEMLMKILTQKNCLRKTAAANELETASRVPVKWYLLIASS